VHRQASVKIVDDEDDHSCNVAPINPSHILELAGGSDDDHDIDMPGLEEVDDNKDSDSEDSDTEDDEGLAESAEAQLSGFS